MIRRAVFERITDGNIAIILVEEDEIEYLIDINQLPKESREGDLLQVDLDGDKIIEIKVDIEETEKVKKRINEKMEHLRRKSGSKFIKK